MDIEVNTGGALRSVLISVIRVAAFAYVGLIILMAGCQRNLIYYPRTGDAEQLRALATRTAFESWSGDGVEQHGWRSTLPDGEAEANVLVFHGNAGWALDRLHYRDALMQVSGDRWRVHVLEYPGFGARPGRPSETAFFDAAEPAVRDLLAEEKPLYLIGESLGSGVASEMAARHPDGVAGLILITPFTSLADVAARHYPFLPVRLMLRDRFDNETALTRFEGPVAVLVAERDRVVPAVLGKALYEGYQGPRKLWVQEGRDHNTLDLSPDHPWWRELVDFLESNQP